MRCSGSQRGSAPTHAPVRDGRSGTSPTSSSPPGSPSTATPAPTSPPTRPSVPLDYDQLPSAREAQTILEHRQRRLSDLRSRADVDWELRVAEKQEDWARLLVETTARDGAPTCALHLQAIRIGHIAIVGLNAELFFETGLEIRARSPSPNTFALGYTNGTVGYLPRAEDYPAGGWRLDESYAVPDLIFQVHPHPVALHPGSEQRAVAGALALLGRL